MIPTFHSMEDQRTTPEGNVHRHNFENGFSAFAVYIKEQAVYVVKCARIGKPPDKYGKNDWYEMVDTTAFGPPSKCSSLFQCNLAIRQIAELLPDGSAPSPDDPHDGVENGRWWDR